MNVPRHTAEMILAVAALERVQPNTSGTLPETIMQGPDLRWRDEVWTSADGLGTKLCDLEDNHLRNIIMFLNRETGYVFASLKEPRDAIIDFNNVLLVRQPIYNLMLREADYRKLSWR